MYRGKYCRLLLILTALIAMVSQSAMAKDVTLTLMYQSSGEETGDRWMEDNVALFQELHPNIKIEVTANTYGDQYLTQITTMMATGRPPDVFASWTLGRLEPFVSAGRVYNLKPELEKDPGFAEFLQQEPLASTTFNGGIYGIPHNLAAELVYYNKEVFDQFGLTVPTTYDEFLNIVEVLKANDIIPIALGNAETWTGTIPYMMITERVGGLDTYERVVIEGNGQWTEEPFVKSAELLQELIAMGAFEPNVNGIRPEEARGKFMTGKAGMWMNGTWDIGIMNYNMGVDGYGLFNFPDIPGGKGSRHHYIAFVDQAFCIGENCRNKAEAMEFLKFICSPERQDALVKTGVIPSTHVKVDPAAANPRLVEALDLMASATGLMYPWDIPLGPFLGAEINKTAQLLYMGQDPEQALAQFQQLVDSQ